MLRIMRALDSTDIRLLLALTENPRATTVALSESLFLSRNTVQARLTNLEASGAFLPFDRSIDQTAIGLPLTAFTTVYATQQKLGQIVIELAKIPEIVQAHGLSGPSDLLLRIACASAEDLFRINAKILECPGVERTETAFSVSEVIPYRLTPLMQRLLDD